MPSSYPNAEQRLIRIRDSDDNKEQIREIIDTMQEMGEQIRYQFRHVGNKELSQEIKSIAEAQAVVNKGLEQQIEQESGVLLYIDSSRGTVFKNNMVETRLTVVIYKRGERITNAERMRAVFGSNARLQWSWQRMDDDRYGIISADDSRILDDGFTFICSAEDVDVKVTFACELITD